MYLRTALWAIWVSLTLSTPFVWAQSIGDGVSVYKLSDFQSGRVKNCPIIQGALADKLYKKGTRAYVALTANEYTTLVGSNADYIGLSGGTLFYSRETGGLVGAMHIYMMQSGHDMKDPSVYSNPEILSKMENASIDDLDGNIPVLCGDGSVEQDMAANVKAREKIKADKVEYEKTCEVCTLAGGYYLQAIYDGDFDKQNTLAVKYLNQIASSGGDEAMALGTIISSLTANGSDFTFLEDALGYYLLATSRKWPKQCFGPESSAVTFTTTYPEQIYETLDGIYLGSDASVTKTTNYTIKPEFNTACSSMCNKNGSILLTARLAGQSEALSVYKGISELLAKHDCDGELIQQFESNLLDMWRQEKALPRSVRRNSIGNYWRR